MTSSKEIISGNDWTKHPWPTQVHGYTTMNVRAEEKAPGEIQSIIEEIAYSNTFPRFDFTGRKTQYIIGKYVKLTPPNSDKEDVYFYQQRYYVQNGVVKIEHKLFKLSDWYLRQEEVELTWLNELFSQYKDTPEETKLLDDIPVVQANELKLGWEKFGNSVIEEILRIAIRPYRRT